MYHRTQISYLEDMSSANQWCVPDEATDALYVDFDRGFSSLEVDVCSSANNASSVFAVPDISLRKEEIKTSSFHGSEKRQIECYPVSLFHGKKIRYSQLTDIDCTNSVKRICFNKELEHSENFQATRSCSHNISAPEVCTSSHFYTSGSVINTVLSQVVQLPFIQPPGIETGLQNLSTPLNCILMAPTSITTKINEETLTYLNQGQPYEIRIQKTSCFTYEKDLLLKTIVSIGFQEKRLQYSEKEQIKEWQNQRYDERILEVDIPLSYGIIEVAKYSNINDCEFIWNPNQEVGIFLKINCISTEFTPRKHGGEKGVPFRILIETFKINGKKLHSASCQVKVFKPKGADRKHKTDREKMYKRLQTEKEKYHPAFECTVFQDLHLRDSWPINDSFIQNKSSEISPTPSSPVSSGCSPSSPLMETLLDADKNSHSDKSQVSPSNFFYDGNIPLLTRESSVAECTLWLQKNKFHNFITEFSNFSGSDLLTLNRSDLIDICGPANGIRLFNILHGKGYLTTYVRFPSQKAYTAIYLKTPEVHEFISKLKRFCGFPTDDESEVYVSGPFETRVVITEEVISHKLQDSVFVVECCDGIENEECCVILKHIVN